MADLLERYSGPTNFPGTDCTPPVFPDPSFLDCPDDYTAWEGEITDLFISNVVKTNGVWVAVAKPTAWGTAADYLAAGIERLIGFGDKPIGEPITVPMPKQQLKIVDRKHTLNFDVTDLKIVNYDFVRSLQATNYAAIWYWDMDGRSYGGATGIICRVVNAGNVHARGEQALLTGTMIFEWKNLFDPPTVLLDDATPLTVGKVAAPEALKSSKKQLEATV